MDISTRKTWLYPLAGALMAMFVALGIALSLAPAQAFADDLVAAQTQADNNVTVALTVVDEQDNLVVCNKKITGLTTENTVADLLTAAGYTQVDTWADDAMTYVDQYGSPYFLGKDYDFETGMYWVTIFDGSSNNYADAFLTSNLKNGGHYQYVYTNRSDPDTYETTFEYTGAIPDPLTTETPEAAQLIDNLTKRFEKNGKDGKLSNYTYGAALGLAYLGKEALVDIDFLEAEADKIEGAGTLAKYVMALSAAGDTEAAEFYMDRIDRTLEKTESFYDLVLILPAYNMVGMEPSGAKYTKTNLIESILAQQTEDGLFPLQYSGAQETGEALFALAPYADDATVAGVSDALAKARAAIVDQMDPNTGIILPNPMWSSATMDVDAMGEAIDGLIAFEMAKNGEVSAETLKLADALANGADSSLDGYVNVGTFDETASSAVALRGLGAAFAHGWKAQALDYATIADFTAMTYTGSALESDCTVKMGETVLQKGIDYAVDYNNNVNVGTATAVISGIGKYYGSVEKTFTINAAAISSASIAKIANKKYTGKNIEPAITMKLGDKKLVKDTDYAVSYKNNKKVGKATVTITGKGNLTGTAKTTFKIAAVSITKAKISKIANKKYTGKNIKPKPVVKFNGKKLKKGTDYKVSYKNNKKVGKATVIIKGKGNFKGTAKKTFKIVNK